MDMKTRFIVRMQLFALAALLVGARAVAVPFADGGVALQTVLNNITVNPLGASSVNVLTDEVSPDSYWSVTAAGGAVSTIIVELAAFKDGNKFGIYDRADPSKTVQVFAGLAGAGDTAVISIKADGSVFVNFADTGVNFAANSFGFYLDSSAFANGGFWRSDTALNGDGLDHMAAYRGEGDTVMLPGLPPSTWTPEEFVLGFEDLDASVSDKDFKDFVVMVESIKPVPDGGSTLVLLGSALLAVGGIARRMRLC